ncbi:hypothetical protein [Aquihabitans sp. McL0605]|uniref:hypothetical protein n=1 Tax=Aquihabitans sp. McL0605 TaxID=3415671 RepID=UPI003CE8F6AF
MSATPIRRRATRVVALAAVSLIMLGGCSAAQRAPSSYDGARDNFIEGCESVAKSDNSNADAKGQADVTKIASPKDYCTCVFAAYKKNVPYSDFKKTKARMDDEGGPLPDSFIKAFSSCKADAS